jgi:hypothetical protein
MAESVFNVYYHKISELYMKQRSHFRNLDKNYPSTIYWCKDLAFLTLYSYLTFFTKSLFAMNMNHFNERNMFENNS